MHMWIGLWMGFLGGFPVSPWKIWWALQDSNL
jgi:hypothetical protein